jgi:hypothetical protein
MAIVDFLAAEHRQCDEIFTIAEEAAHTGDLASCRSRFQQFQAAMEQHFQKGRSRCCFRPLRKPPATPWGRPGHAAGASADAGNLGGMATALANGDLEDYLGQAETLLILMQQHNIKEEQMLYPMSDRFLGSVADGVIQAHAGISSGASPMTLPEIVVDGRGLEHPEPMERVLAALDEVATRPAGALSDSSPAVSTVRHFAPSSLPYETIAGADGNFEILISGP